MSPAEYESKGYADMERRVRGGGDWSIASACPYRDGWQRERWQDGAWRFLQQERKSKPVR